MMKVLWIDDEIDLLKPLIIFLENKGYELDISNNGVEGIEMFKNNNYSAVLLDENMIGLSGLEVLNIINELDYNIPIIMITKSEEENIMEDAIGNKISDYLIKPVNPNQILLSLKKALSQTKLVSERTLTNYQQEFRKISNDLIYANNYKDWINLYLKLIYWELQLNDTDESTMQEILISQKAECNNGDLLLIMAGEKDKTRKALSVLRLYLAEELGLRNPKEFAPLWVLDFPLLEWDEDSQRYHAMHHPFTSPKQHDIEKLDTDPASVRANAYDLVLNGNEIGGGSIRIHDRDLQKLMFHHLGFSEDDANDQFGFLMDAFEYGAPPHGGVAFGFDRLCSIIGEKESIRDFIAFPKNNSGRDVMINSPSIINSSQLDELNISLKN